MSLDDPIVLDIKYDWGPFIKYEIEKTPKKYITKTGSTYIPKLEKEKFYKLENAEEIVINNLHNYPIKSSIFQLVEGGIIFYDNNKHPLPAAPQFQSPENIIKFEVVTEKNVPSEEKSSNKKTKQVKNLPKFDANANAAKIKLKYYDRAVHYVFKQYDDKKTNWRGKEKSIEFKDKDIGEHLRNEMFLLAGKEYLFGKNATVKYNNVIIKTFKIMPIVDVLLPIKVSLFDENDKTLEVNLSKPNPINFTVELKSNGGKRRTKNRGKRRGGTRKMKNYSSRL